MTVIAESDAWDILDSYAGDCLQIDSPSLLAIYAIGSLPGGYYRPGQSDIDAVLIVRNGSESIWGNSDTVSARLAALNREYRESYGIPKDFGPFPLQESELYPPYNPDRDLVTLEIARLKLQSKRVHGAFDLAPVPMPTADDFLRDAQRFEEWMRDEFLPITPIEKLSPIACVNCILIYLGRFLRIRRGVIEFNKLKLIDRYLDNEPPFVDKEMFRLVAATLRGDTPSESEIERLRSHTGMLRSQMNVYVGISL